MTDLQKEAIAELRRRLDEEGFADVRVLWPDPPLPGKIGLGVALRNDHVVVDQANSARDMIPYLLDFVRSERAAPKAA